MDIRQMQYFMRVYEERSFSRAAQRAHVVQPALSMQIRRLEEELNTSLFDRTSKGIEPTIAGERFYQLVCPIVHAVANARQEIVELGKGERITGILRVGLPPSVNLSIIGSILTEYTATYPDVRIIFTEAYSDALTEMLENGDLDFALAALPGEHSGLDFRLALRDRLLLVASQAVRNLLIAPRSLCDFNDLKLIIPSPRTALGNMVRNRIMTGELIPKQVIEIDGVTSTLELIKSSNWVGIFPYISMWREIEEQNFFCYPIADPHLSFDLYFVHDRKKPLTLACKIFVDMLENTLNHVVKSREKLLKHSAIQ